MVAPVQRPPMLLAFESHGAWRGDGDTGGYMVQRCAVHCSGALLLEPSEGDAFDSALEPRHVAAAAPVAPPQPTGNEPMEGGWGGDVWADDAPVVVGDGDYDDDDDHGGDVVADAPPVDAGVSCVSVLQQYQHHAANVLGHTYLIMLASVRHRCTVSTS